MTEAASPDARCASQPTGKLKILHVVRQFHPSLGGLEDFVTNLGREQVRNGCNVRVVTCDRLFSRPETRLPKHDELDGIAITRLPFYGSNRYPIVPALLSEIGDAQIVHVHAIDFFFDALALTRFWHRKPLVATTHGGFFHTKEHARLKSVWFQGPTRLSALAYGAIVGCSVNDSQRFTEIAGPRVTTIENGVDLGKFSKMASASPVKSIVTIGRFSTNKRLDRLIAVMAELARRDAAWHLHIVGASSDWTASDLEAASAAAGVAQNVTIHAELPDRDIAGILGQASFFLSASEFEGFGIALIEAMSAGLVPIVHPNASFKALAARHPAIRLADFTNPSAVADEVEAAWRDRDSIIETDLSNHAWSTVASRYDSVYAELLRP
jgi:alpha-1,3-mannosyltransferase